MKKHFRCIIDICDNNMQYPKLHKKHNNVDGDIIMHNLPKDGVVKAAWINTLKRYKKLIKERLDTFATASLLGWWFIPSPVFNKINTSPVK